jgi:hypothetical protein
MKSDFYEDGLLYPEQSFFIYGRLRSTQIVCFGPPRALLVIAQAQKPSATHNKGGLHFWEDQHGGKKTPATACFFRRTPAKAEDSEEPGLFSYTSYGTFLCNLFSLAINKTLNLLNAIFYLFFNSWRHQHFFVGSLPITDKIP